MDQSPKGRDIETLYGDAEAIIARGKQIKTLGDRMISSADMLKKLKDGATGQKGLAVEKLQDKVGDCYEDLHKAGERYQPTGPVLIEYGTELASTQPLIKTDVSNCEELWATYQAKSGAADDADPGFRLPDLTPPTDEEKTARDKEDKAFAAAKAEAQQAYDAWKEEAERFDTHYDTWEEAFDKAADGVGDATHGNISDGFWDNVDGFVAGVMKVLSIAGIILGILAIIVGGPLIGALAAIVAVATLALTIYQKVRGDASWGDLALAVVGVIPIGKLGVFFKDGAKFSTALKTVAKESPLNLGKQFSTVIGESSTIFGAASRGFTRGGGGFAGLWRGARGMAKQMNGDGTFTITNAIARAVTGKSTKEIAKVDFGDPFEVYDLYKGTVDAVKGLPGYANNLIGRGW